MSWIRPDSWFTYLSLDAPEQQVYYDLDVSNAGIIRVAPYGTLPMKVGNETSSKDLPSWIPALPLNTPQWVGGTLLPVPVALFGRVWLRRNRTKQIVQAS